jgi:hypothetical protein
MMKNHCGFTDNSLASYLNSGRRQITIGVPEFNAQFFALGFAEKRGFFKENGLQREIIRINPTFDPQRCAKAARNRPEVKISWIGSNVVEEDG